MAVDPEIRSLARELRAVSLATAAHIDDPAAAAAGMARAWDVARRALQLLPHPGSDDGTRNPAAAATAGPAGQQPHRAVPTPHDTHPYTAAGTDGHHPGGDRHTHVWPGPYTSCACGQHPPDQPRPGDPMTNQQEIDANGRGRP